MTTTAMMALTVARLNHFSPLPAFASSILNNRNKEVKNHPLFTLLKFVCYRWTKRKENTFPSSTSLRRLRVNVTTASSSSSSSSDVRRDQRADTTRPSVADEMRRTSQANGYGVIIITHNAQSAKEKKSFVSHHIHIWLRRWQLLINQRRQRRRWWRRRWRCVLPSRKLSCVCLVCGYVWL